jgi:hypothetical protein
MEAGKLQCALFLIVALFSQEIWSKDMSATERKLNDDELLAADIRDLTQEQVNQRHDALVRRNPIPGALVKLSKEQTRFLIEQVTSQFPELLHEMRQAGNKYKTGGSAEEYDTAIYATIIRFKQFCRTVGYDPGLYNVVRAYDELYPLTGLNEID